MPYKDPEKRKQYIQNYTKEHSEEHKKKCHDYYLKNKVKLLAQAKDYHQKNKVHRNEMSREWKRKLRERLRIEIGSKCCICGIEPKSIRYHEKNFKPHLGLTSKHSGESNPKYILEHKEDFVPICLLCHKTLHRLKRYLEKFKQLLD